MDVEVGLEVIEDNSYPLQLISKKRFEKYGEKSTKILLEGESTYDKNTYIYQVIEYLELPKLRINYFSSNEIESIAGKLNKNELDLLLEIILKLSLDNKG